jgi:transcriptional regulator with XRE-family HTH domain
MQEEIREFLTTRRARLSPEQAGLPAHGGPRRVPGLRREEVALLAGVTVDYYSRLERGNLAHASDSVLDALARALHLSDDESNHLYDLARTARTSPVAARRRAATSPPARVTPSQQRLLDAMTDAPAWIRNSSHDFLAGNTLGRALYADMLASPYGPPNSARFIFLDVRSRDLFPQWDQAADETVAVLRGAAGRNPYDRDLSNLVGELATRSEAFRRRWAQHDVRLYRTGTKRLHHSHVGDIELDFEVLTLDVENDVALLAYTAKPGTPSFDALQLLASWAATRESDNTPHTATPAPMAD